MQVKLMGVMKVDFTNNKGESVSGVNLFVAFKDENVDGLHTEKVFVRSDIALPKDIKVNDILEVSFNHKGRVMGISKE